MRLFVTGGSGFIGRHLLKEVASRVDACCVPSRSGFAQAQPNVSYVRYDGSTEGLCAALSAFKPDAVIHCAAAGVSPDERDNRYLAEVNSILPARLLVAAQDCGVKAFIHLGSMAEYRPPEDNTLLQEEGPITLHGAYGASKAAATSLLSVLATNQQSSCCVLSLRIFGVYGPGEAQHRLTSQILRKTRKRETVELSAGTQIRDFIYIKDVIGGIWAGLTYAMSCSGGYDIINIGSGHEQSVRDFVLNFCKAGALDTDRLKFGALPMRDTDAPYLVADIRKAKQLLGWQPEWVSRGLEDFFQSL